MADQVTLLADVVNKGRLWVIARHRFKFLSDSKSAKQEDVQKAGRAAVKAADELDTAFVKLFKVEPNVGIQKRRTPPFDWGKVAGVIAKGASALEDALKKRPGTTEVIDTEGSEV